jgi:hypothetical protein
VLSTPLGQWIDRFEWERFERNRIDASFDQVPADADGFSDFFRRYCAGHRLTGHPLFDFIELEATREEIVRLGQAGQPWDFLPVCWQVLRVAPGDDGLRLLAAANLARLGLRTAALEELERITHPPTVREILRRARTSSASVVVIDAIKLFESGLAHHCNQNWAVYCDPSIQKQRLMDRNGLPGEQAEQRINAQPPQDEKMRLADTVIDNSGDVDDTREQVARSWELIGRA